MEARKLIHNGKELLIAHGSLHQIGDQKPYFSLTGEIWKANAQGRPYGRDCEACGMLHSEILAAFPDMADLAALHLADEDGLPMYHIENGWYWNGGTKYQEYNRKFLANLLRITEEDADELHRTALTKADFAEQVDAMRPRWKAEALAAIEKYSLRKEPT